MSLIPYKVVALARTDTNNLNIIPLASVTILTSGGAFAALKEADGTTPVGNPFNCDSNGEREVYLAGGDYSVSVAGGQSWEIRLSGASDIQSVATIADLRLLAGVVVGQKFYLYEHTSGFGSAGGGSFTARTGVDADDNGEIIVTANGVRVWRDDVGYLTPAFYGARCNGVVNDNTAITAMFATVSRGKRVFDFLRREHYAGTVSVHEASKFRFVAINDITIKGMPTFYVDNTFATQDIRYESIFEFVDCSELYVECKAVSTIDMTAPQPSGVICVNLISDTVSARNVYVNADCSGGLAPFHTTNSWGITRARTGADPFYTDIRFDLVANNVKYGTRMIGCGNNVSGKITTTGATRSYFVTGVTGHNVRVNSTGQRYLTDILIKSYLDNTSEINVELVQKGSTSTEDAIAIEHENSAQGTTISDVTIGVNCDRPNGNIVMFGSIDIATALYRTTTTNITKDITIKWNGANSTVDGTAIRFRSTQSTPACLRIDRCFEITGITSAGYTIQRGGSFSAIALAGNSIKLLSDAASSTGMISQITLRNTSDWTDVAAANRFSALYLVEWYRLSGGTGVVGTVTTVASQTVGVAPTITWSVAGGALIVSTTRNEANAALSAVMISAGDRFS